MGVNREGPAVPWVNVLVARDQKTNKPIAVLFEHPAPSSHRATRKQTRQRRFSRRCCHADTGKARERCDRHVRGKAAAEILIVFRCGSRLPMPTTAGRTLGDATLKAIEQSEPIAATELTLRKEQIHIPTRPLPSPELVAELKEKNKDNPARLKQLDKIFRSTGK